MCQDGMGRGGGVEGGIESRVGTATVAGGGGATRPPTDRTDLLISACRWHNQLHPVTGTVSGGHWGRGRELQHSRALPGEGGGQCGQPTLHHRPHSLSSGPEFPALRAGCSIQGHAEGPRPAVEARPRDPPGQPMEGSSGQITQILLRRGRGATAT